MKYRKINFKKFAERDKMKELKNIKRTTLSKEWATLDRIDYDYQFKTGEWKRVSRECYNRGN